jgi:hypothetical protein
VAAAWTRGGPRGRRGGPPLTPARRRRWSRCRRRRTAAPGTAIPEPHLAPATVERWLEELGLAAEERAERDGITSWDLRLDGVRRHDIPFTLILDPALALVCWVQYAPPINDSFRVSYRKLLRWNDELPFVKFAIAPDERPVLTAELPPGGLDRERLGLTLARLVAVCDLLVADSVRWLWPGSKRPPVPVRPGRHHALLDRYADQLRELVVTEPEETPQPPDDVEPDRGGASGSG